jgi:hypothetical protein
MYTVTWTIDLNEGASRQDILLELEASKEDYAGADGLLKAVLGFSSDNKTVIEITVWKSQESATAFFTNSWETKLSRRWQSAPMRRQDWETPCMVSNEPERVAT